MAEDKIVVTLEHLLVVLLNTNVHIPIRVKKDDKEVSL